MFGIDWDKAKYEMNQFAQEQGIPIATGDEVRQNIIGNLATFGMGFATGRMGLLRNPILWPFHLALLARMPIAYSTGVALGLLTRPSQPPAEEVKEASESNVPVPFSFLSTLKKIKHNKYEEQTKVGIAGAIKGEKLVDARLKGIQLAYQMAERFKKIHKKQQKFSIKLGKPERKTDRSPFNTPAGEKKAASELNTFL